MTEERQGWDMQYKKFGNTGIQISKLGFGAMRLPYKDGKVDMEESVRMFHAALDGGVNYIDSAPFYCDGDSEIAVGEALKCYKGKKPYISTKYPTENAAKPDDLERNLENSLKKMQADAIDFYHFWGINWEGYQNAVVKNNLLDRMRRLKEEGLIRHISFSFHDSPDKMIEIIKHGEGIFETVLCQYNLLDRANEDAIAYAAAQNMGVVIMGPVAGGRLGAPSEDIRNMIDGTSSTAELALRFVMSNENVSCALSGMSTMEQVKENLKIASDSSPLTAEEVGTIHKVLEEKKQLAQLYCTGCNYCVPCPKGVNIPKNFELMNIHKIYGLTEYAKKEYTLFGTDQWHSGKAANECVDCGVCETKCPQHLEIRKQLKETAAALC